MTDVEEVEVVVAHHERATLRVGDVFLKIDADQPRTDVEVEAMAADRRTQGTAAAQCHCLRPRPTAAGAPCPCPYGLRTE